MATGTVCTWGNPMVMVVASMNSPHEPRKAMTPAEKSPGAVSGSMICQ